MVKVIKTLKRIQSVLQSDIFMILVITLIDGTTKMVVHIEIVPERLKVLEQGRVVEGNTDVTYIYKQVFGDVVVHYVDSLVKEIKEM